MFRKIIIIIAAIACIRWRLKMLPVSRAAYEHEHRLWRYTICLTVRRTFEFSDANDGRSSYAEERHSLSRKQYVIAHDKTTCKKRKTTGKRTNEIVDELCTSVAGRLRSTVEWQLFNQTRWTDVRYPLRTNSCSSLARATTTASGESIYLLMMMNQKILNESS